MQLHLLLIKTNKNLLSKWVYRTLCFYDNNDVRIEKRLFPEGKYFTLTSYTTIYWKNEYVKVSSEYF